MMKVCLIQHAAQLGDVTHNTQQVGNLVQQAAKNKPDVLVLPELWDTGFIPTNIRELGEAEPAHSRLQQMKQWAKTNAINIIGGSVSVKEDGNLYNRAYVIDRQGNTVASYDKAHLFSPGKEADYFTAGKGIGVFELDGVPCAIQICYDLRFPELSRYQALSGAHVLFVPAQWPHPRLVHWQCLLQARAIENQLFVIGVNGCGLAGKIQSCGHSSVIDPWGNVQTTPDETERVIETTIHVHDVVKVRQRIPVFDDRRPDLY